MVPVNIMPVLSHIVDDWNDHFSSSFQPTNVTMTVGEFVRPKENEHAYKSRWQSNVSLSYVIRDQTFKSDIFAMDGIYFDLVRKADEGYGQKWVNVYIRESTLLGFRKKFKSDTRWTPCIHGVPKDENQRLRCITAQIGEDDPAKMYEIAFCREAVTDTSVTCADRVAVKYMGSLQDVYSNDNGNAIFKGTGFFSLLVTTVDRSADAPWTDGSNKVSLQFNLAAARLFGVSNGVAVATFGNGKTQMYI